MKLAFRALLLLCALASIVPLFGLGARDLPIADLSELLASAEAIRARELPLGEAPAHVVSTSHGDLDRTSSHEPPGTGAARARAGLYSLVVAVVSLVAGTVERANVVVLASIALAYPWSLRALLVSLGRDPRLALLGSALFWTHGLTSGSVDFVAVVPLVLFALARCARQAEAPTTDRALGLAASSTVIALVHLPSFALFVLQATSMTLFPGRSAPPRGRADLSRRLWSAPRRLVWLAPAVALGVATFIHDDAVARGEQKTEPALGSSTWRPRAWLDRSPVEDVEAILLVASLTGLAMSSRRESAAKTSAHDPRS